MEAAGPPEAFSLINLLEGDMTALLAAAMYFCDTVEGKCHCWRKMSEECKKSAVERLRSYLMGRAVAEHLSEIQLVGILQDAIKAHNLQVQKDRRREHRAAARRRRRLRKRAEHGATG
jgi:hypothetical protein